MGWRGPLAAGIPGLAHADGPARPVVIAGSLCVVAAFAILWIAGASSLIAIALGVLLVDIGLNGALIANQTRAYALVPGARGRINTVLFTAMFLFGALGAFAGSQAFLAAGWSGVCGVGIALAGSALLAAILEAPRRPLI